MQLGSAPRAGISAGCHGLPAPEGRRVSSIGQQAPTPTLQHADLTMSISSSDAPTPGESRRRKFEDSSDEDEEVCC